MFGKYLALCVRHLATTALIASAASGLSTQAFAHDDDAAVMAEFGALSGPPVMAVVSIKEQRISIYDATGAAIHAKVSSGRPDYETPVGTYSILQKNRDHYSNVYDDAAMPFMQRLTWSGVALHEGDLPGYPASHGCVRMPHEYAERIFDMTRVGMRVIIARDNVAPISISHPNLFQPAPMGSVAMTNRTSFEVTGTQNGGSVFEPNISSFPQRQNELAAMRTVYLQKAAEAEQRKAEVERLKGVEVQLAKPQAAAARVLKVAEKAKKSADDSVARATAVLNAAKDPAKLKPYETAKSKAEAALDAANDKLDNAAATVVAATTDKERSKAERAERAAQRAKQAATKQLDRADRDLTAAMSPQRYKKQEESLARATATAANVTQKYAAARAAFDAADKELQTAKEQLTAATATMEAALAASAEAKRKTIPVSMFASLKTGRLYVRQGHEPVADFPITIADPGRPLGTYVFTAVDYEKGGNSLRWTAVSLNRRTNKEVAELSRSKSKSDAAAEPYPTDAGAASGALDRITIPPDVLARFSTAMWPGSSLIVSDEGLSKETNNATDFIVLMSGEPQGGIKRRPKPKPPVVQQFVSENGYVYYGSGNRYYYAPAYKGGYGRPIRVQPKKSFFDWW